MQKSKPILCLDFDGVIHSYDKGWQDGSIYGDVTPGFFEWASEAKKDFTLVIYSSRSKTAEGRDVMWSWLDEKFTEWARRPENCDKPIRDTATPEDFQFAHEKPPAFVTIDDRAITFTGSWSTPWLSPQHLLNFKPWNAKPPAETVMPRGHEFDGDDTDVVEEVDDGNGVLRSCG